MYVVHAKYMSSIPNVCGPSLIYEVHNLMYVVHA